MGPLPNLRRGHCVLALLEYHKCVGWISKGQRKWAIYGCVFFSLESAEQSTTWVACCNLGRPKRYQKHFFANARSNLGVSKHGKIVRTILHIVDSFIQFTQKNKHCNGISEGLSTPMCVKKVTHAINLLDRFPWHKRPCAHTCSASSAKTELDHLGALPTCYVWDWFYMT